MSDINFEKLINDDPRTAYEKLIDQFGGYVYTIAVSKLGNIASKEDIEDCVSDIFVEVYSNLKKYSPSKGEIKVFIGNIAKRRAIDTFRKMSYRNGITVSADDEDKNIGMLSAENDTESEAESNMLRKKLWESVRSLGEPDSNIIIYQYFYRMNIKDIAKKLLMSADAVSKRSQRARQKLKTMLEISMR